MMVSDEERRWLVVGIAMNKVAAPVLRDFIKQGMDTHYANLDIYCSGLTTPCTLKTLTYHHVNTDPSFKHLKFQNVNNNLHLHGKHKNLYNYNINSSVDLAKLFLPEYLAEFSAFDESLDMSAILRLLGYNNPAPIFHSPIPLISIQTSADDVRENVRNKWGHCNVTDWNKVLFNDCFSKLETLVRSLGLTGGMEKTTLDQLSDWITKGCQLVMGHAVDQNLLSLVQHDVKSLQSTLTSMQEQQSATSVELEEHNEQLKAVLKLKDQQMKENEKILEKLASIEKTFSEELLIRVEDAEKGLARTDSKVEQLEQGFAKTDDKVEQLEQGFAKTDDKVEQLEQGFAKTDDKVEQLEQGFAKTDDKVEEIEQGFAKTDDKVEQLEHGVAKVKHDVAETSDKVKQLEQELISQRMKEIKPESFSVDTFDVKCCQRKLAEHYQKTAKVPTTVWSSVFQVDLEQIYTRLSWVKEEQTTAGSSKEELSHYTELFGTKTKGKTVPKRILVQGETGIGKTTFVKRLLVDWSNLQEAKTEEAEEREDAMKKFNDDDVTFSKEDEDVIEGTEDLSTDDEDMDEHRKDGGNFEEAKMDEVRKDALRKFELVVSVNLREVSKCQTLRDIMSHSRLFPEEEEKSIDDLLSHIRNNQENILVVLDGYDEYRTGSEAEEKYGSRRSSPVFKMFHGDMLRDCTVLVTTRSSRADEIRGPADVQAEVTGFNMSDREEFMRKMLDDQTQVDGLVNFLWKSNMEDLARVPLLTLFFCLLWKKEKEKLMELTESKTKLFQAIMKHILQHSHKKHSASHVSRLEENYKDILAEVGKVALAGLLKGDLMFEFDQLPEKVRGEESIIVGLLQLSEYGPSLEPMEMVSFIHKSIQEYLAAWYITYSCVPKGNLGGIEQRASTLEDCKALENVFQFICGLSDDGAVKVFQHLTSVRISVLPGGREGFSDLVYDSFREVRSKAELLTHCFDCIGGIITVTRNRPLSGIIPKVDDLTKLAHPCLFVFDWCLVGGCNKDSVLYKSLQFLDCLLIPLRITNTSDVLTVGDFLRGFQNASGCLRRYESYHCTFSSILRFRNGQFQLYITDLKLFCDDHARLFTETTVVSVPSPSTDLCSEQSCLKFLTSLQSCGISEQIGEALGTAIRNCKHLNSIELREQENDPFMMMDLLEQAPNPVSKLLPRFDNIITLFFDLSDSTAVDTYIIRTALAKLVLSGIRLTPAAAAALGKSLPEMSSLLELELTGEKGSVLQAEDMVALFGGFYKALPVHKLTFNGFSISGCLAPLTKIFHFFPDLTELELEDLNIDEDDQCGLLESLRFIPNLKGLRVKGEPLGDAGLYTAEVNKDGSLALEPHKRLELYGISLTPAAATALGRSLPEMLLLQQLILTGAEGSVLKADEMEALFGGFYKTLPLYHLTIKGFRLAGCLAPLMKSFCFFPNLRKLKLEKLIDMDENHQCCFFESLRFFPNLEILSVKSTPLSHADCCAANVKTVGEFTLNSLKELKLDGINLTPSAATALGWLLPEMSSLEVLKLSGVDGSTVQTKEMEALFGGFHETLPLETLTFSSFSVRSCLGPLTKSLRFFPRLRFLTLDTLNMDEHDLRGLLESFQFIRILKMLSLSGNPLGHAVRSIVPHLVNLRFLSVVNIDKTSSEEDLGYVRETVEQERFEQDETPIVFLFPEEIFASIELELMDRLYGSLYL